LQSQRLFFPPMNYFCQPFFSGVWTQDTALCGQVLYSLSRVPSSFLLYSYFLCVLIRQHSPMYASCEWNRR
jgi:hypothetical protein